MRRKALRLYIEVSNSRTLKVSTKLSDHKIQNKIAAFLEKLHKTKTNYLTAVFFRDNRDMKDNRDSRDVVG
jgi:hypothetical protein